MAFVYLFVSIACNVAGQILMKYAADSLNLDNGIKLGTLISILLNAAVVTGIIFYMIGLFTWLVTLTKLELSLAYPFQALSFILVGISSVIIFNESITIYKAIGFILITLGILVVSISSHNV